VRLLKELVPETRRKSEKKNIKNFSNGLSLSVFPRCQRPPEGGGAVPTMMTPRKPAVRRLGGAKCGKVTRRYSR